MIRREVHGASSNLRHVQALHIDAQCVCVRQGLTNRPRDAHSESGGGTATKSIIRE